MKFRLTQTVLILFSLFLISCDNNLAFVASRNTGNNDGTPLKVRANIVSSQAGQFVQVNQPSLLPDNIHLDPKLAVIVDNSNNKVAVTRNSDGTLRFPLTASSGLRSNGQLSVLFVTEKGQSHFIILDTSPLLTLSNPPLKITPSDTVIKGTKIELKANLKEPISGLNYSWFYGDPISNRWTPISGNTEQVSWEPLLVGNFHIKIEATTSSGAFSSYVTPTAQITVKDSDTIAIIKPLDGNILKGETVDLSANIPELKEKNINYRWAFGPSPQGPFTPISESGKDIKWEPLSTGSFYIQIEALGDSTSTYTSSKPLVSVSNSDTIVLTTPSSGQILRGENITLAANLPGNNGQNLTYNWLFGFSPQATFTPISGSKETVQWQPSQTGEFYIRLKTFNKVSNDSTTYTTSKAIVSVSDSDSVFNVAPSGNIFKGESVQLTIDNNEIDSFFWSFSSSAQGPFVTLPGSGKSVNWAPPQTGSFFIRAEGRRTDGTTAKFTSANALVLVSEKADVIQTSPALAEINLGQSARLIANIPNIAPNSRFSWSFSTTSTGPFTTIEPLSSQGSNQQLTWIPTQIGSFFLKVDISNPNNQSNISFTTITPQVFVKEDQPFFSTDPTPANIKNTNNVTIKAAFNPGVSGFSYGWSYARTSTGPFTPIGGSIAPEVVWKSPNIIGSYYIKFEATSSGSNQVISFTSKSPLVFLNTTDSPGEAFGEF